jgi:hypothetical protein
MNNATKVYQCVDLIKLISSFIPYHMSYYMENHFNHFFRMFEDKRIFSGDTILISNEKLIRHRTEYYEDNTIHLIEFYIYRNQLISIMNNCKLYKKYIMDNFCNSEKFKIGKCYVIFVDINIRFGNDNCVGMFRLCMKLRKNSCKKNEHPIFKNIDYICENLLSQRYNIKSIPIEI